MTNRPYAPSVVVSATSVDSDDPYDVIYSNITFVNALFGDALLHDGEVSRNALLSYYVDYYLAQVDNGGFSQFVWNSRWNDNLVTLVREGLQAVGASRHLALFEEGAQLVAGLGTERLAAFLAGEYFGADDPEREELDTLTNRFFELSEEEDLIALNAAWLRGLANLTTLSIEDMRAEIERIASAVPDRADRIARAQASAPAYVKIIRALCERGGHTLDEVTAGDPNHTHEGQTTVAWHFITDQGHHYMVQTEDKALMFKADAPAPIAELSAAMVERLTESAE